MERLNFIPNVQNYAGARYEYRHTQIESSPLNRTKSEVLNYGNTLEVGYARRVRKDSFLGVNIKHGQDKDSGPRYGVDEDKRFRSEGFREPQIFFNMRLRPQEKERGNIDMHVFYIKSFGEREVGTHRSNQMNGRSEANLEFSYGFHEDEWEFKTALGFIAYETGRENNKYTDKKSRLDPYNNYYFLFQTQYQLNSYWYLIPGIGFYYQGTQRMRDQAGLGRSIQAGSGSHFELATKYMLDNLSFLTLKTSYRRNDYFVKSDDGNFDGRLREILAGLSYVRGF